LGLVDLRSEIIAAQGTSLGRSSSLGYAGVVVGSSAMNIIGGAVNMYSHVTTDGQRCLTRQICVRVGPAIIAGAGAGANGWFTY
jgi:serine acetyltransferase